MKNEQGVTLIALIIYVILMTFVIAGISAITTSFYSNVNGLDMQAESAVSFAKLNMYLLNDIKSDTVSIYGDISDNEFQLLLANGEIAKYSVQNGNLYRNKVKICGNIKDAEFRQSGVNSITISLLINDYEKTTTYVLEPKEA